MTDLSGNLGKVLWETLVPHFFPSRVVIIPADDFDSLPLRAAIRDLLLESFNGNSHDQSDASAYPDAA